MYKVFVNDIPIILSTEKDIGKRYKSKPIKKVKIKKLIKRLYEGEQLYINLYHKTEEKLFKQLRKKLKVVVAGGGMVYNDNKEILFIHRNGRWDLPKGKIEKDESIETCALREVEEETGVKGLSITKQLQTTYHVFRRNGKFRLKETFWYEMHTSSTDELIPQKEEGIKKAKWLNFEKTQKALDKSYENIKMIFPKEYLVKHPNDRVS